MVEKHRNFVQAYLQCFDAAEAARRAQCGADALARPAVRRELAAQRSRGVPGREDKFYETYDLQYLCYIILC